MRSRRLLVLAATVVILASTGCADFHRGSAPRDGGDLGDSSQVGDPAFEKLVYPILELDCSYCHSANGAAAYTSFVLTGNAVPKVLTPLAAMKRDPARVQAFRRFAGWAWVLTGIAYSLAWLALPTRLAVNATFIIVPLGMLLVSLGWLRLQRNP